MQRPTSDRAHVSGSSHQNGVVGVSPENYYASLGHSLGNSPQAPRLTFVPVLQYPHSPQQLYLLPPHMMTYPQDGAVYLPASSAELSPHDVSMVRVISSENMDELFLGAEAEQHRYRRDGGRARAEERQVSPGHRQRHYRLDSEQSPDR